MGKLPREMGGEEWKHGLFGCCDMGCMGWCINIYCCGPCNAGHAAEKSGCGNCVLNCLCLNCTHCFIRKHVAEKYKIEDGGAFMSIVKAICCGMCSISQVIQEVAERENCEINFKSWVSKPGAPGQQSDAKGPTGGQA